MHIFTKNLGWFFLYISILEESWDPGLTVWHGYLKGHILCWCYSKLFIDWSSNVSLHRLSWIWVLRCLIPACLVPSIMSLIHRGHFSFWNTWAKFTLSQFWKERLIAPRVGSQSWFSCWSRLILVFYVLLWSQSDCILITNSLSGVWWHIFLLLTSNRMFHSSDMAWMCLSLHHFCWFCQSSSPPDRCWLVHLLVLIELVIVLAFRGIVIESTCCPSWLVWRDRLLHRVAIFWVLWVLRLQSWHISLSFCTFANRHTAFCSV